MPRKSQSDRASVQRAMLYLGVAGLTLAVYMAAKGRDGFITSLDGWETRDWPLVEGHLAHNGTMSSADMLWWPPYEQTWKRYSYEVNGILYHSSKYDVHGNAFVGTKAAVNAYRRQTDLTVYYNPEDPAEAVLKKGVSFDRSTVLRIRWTLLGLVMALAAPFGYRATKRIIHPPALPTELEIH